MSLIYPIDENGLVTLKLSTELQPPDTLGHIRMELHSTGRLQSFRKRRDSLVSNLSPFITIEDDKPDAPLFSNHVVTLKINGERYADFHIHGHDITLRNVYRKLSVSDVRMMGRTPDPTPPLSISEEDFRSLSQYTPKTDLHSHFSTQVSADDLFDMELKREIAIQDEIGQKQKKIHSLKEQGQEGPVAAAIASLEKEIKDLRRKKVIYPLSALRFHNRAFPKGEHIDFTNAGADDIKVVKFIPHANHKIGEERGTEQAIPLTSIHPDDLHKLKKKMRLPPDTTGTYGMMEGCYQPREPFTKNIHLLKDMLRAVARDYQKQGIVYAEPSSTEVTNPEWLKIIHAEMPAITAETGVTLRFKAGLPRSLNEAQFEERIERYKRVAASPYIAGVDLLGYEVNKTYKMKKKLTELADWMDRNAPQDILQIHAGENGKNPKNVREALQLASHHNIMLHLGHSIHGVDDATLQLASRLSEGGQLITQFNIDSNIALNNIDFPADAGIRHFLDADIPSVLCSDGADIYHTNARQITMTAFQAGLTPEHFKKIHATEETYIRRQKAAFEEKAAVFEEKKRQFEQEHGHGFFENPPVKSPSEEPAKAGKVIALASERHAGTLKRLDQVCKKRRPAYFGGAGGESWKDVSPECRAEIQKALPLLLEKLDPGKFYILKGRTKETGGVNTDVENAVKEYNSHHRNKFYCITMQAESEPVATKIHSEHFPVLNIDPLLLQLPSAMANFLSDSQGFAFFFGGKSFTRDMISLSHEQGVPFGIMVDANGASAEKSRIYPDHVFKGAEGLLKYADKIGLTGKNCREPEDRPDFYGKFKSIYGFFGPYGKPPESKPIHPR